MTSKIQVAFGVTEGITVVAGVCEHQPRTPRAMPRTPRAMPRTSRALALGFVVLVFQADWQMCTTTIMTKRASDSGDRTALVDQTRTGVAARRERATQSFGLDRQTRVGGTRIPRNQCNGVQDSATDEKVRRSGGSVAPQEGFVPLILAG
jgi:hypothetical protein